MMELHGVIREHRIVYPNGQEDLLMRWTSTLKDGARVKTVHTRESRMKTNAQVKTHWGLVVAIVREAMIDQGWAICGVAPNKNMVYDILIKACGGVGDMGETITLSEMSISQASQFFSNCCDWAATQLHLVIPEPNKNWREFEKNLDESPEKH